MVLKNTRLDRYGRAVIWGRVWETGKYDQSILNETLKTNFEKKD